MSTQYFSFAFKTSKSPEDVFNIYQDGCDDIYMQIAPFWSGEDSVLEELKAKNIDAEYL